jgi:hypothetical protein
MELQALLRVKLAGLRDAKEEPAQGARRHHGALRHPQREQA